MSLSRGATLQLQVIHATVLRETRTRFGDHQLGYLWALLQPMLWVGTFWGSFVLAHRRIPSGMDVVGFLATGILTYDLFSKNSARLSEAINGNKALLFYPQVQPLDLVIARWALETATLTAVFLLIMGANMLFGGEAAGPQDLLMVATGLGLAAALGGAFGTVLCMLGVISSTVERLRGPVMRPLFWVSGLFYTLADVPEGARKLLLYNPVLHTVEIVRDGWFSTYESPDVSPGYVLACVLGLTLLGLLLERVVRRKVELT